MKKAFELLLKHIPNGFNNEDGTVTLTGTVEQFEKAMNEFISQDDKRTQLLYDFITWYNLKLKNQKGKQPLSTDVRLFVRETSL